MDEGSSEANAQILCSPQVKSHPKPSPCPPGNPITLCADPFKTRVRRSLRRLPAGAVSGSLPRPHPGFSASSAVDQHLPTGELMLPGSQESLSFHRLKNLWWTQLAQQEGGGRETLLSYRVLIQLSNCHIFFWLPLPWGDFLEGWAQAPEQGHGDPNSQRMRVQEEIAQAGSN